MLGTTIIAAALATGDTMSHTIRSAAVAALGRTDEVVVARTGRRRRRSRRSAATRPPRATSRRAPPAASRGAAALGAGRRRRRRSIVEPIAVQDVTTAPERAARHAVRERSRPLRGVRRRSRSDVGDGVASPTCARARSISTRRPRTSLGARRRRHVRVLVGDGASCTRCASATSSGTTAAARPTRRLLMPLAAAQRAAREAGPGQARASSSNHGGATAAPRAPTRSSRARPGARDRSASRPTTASRTRSSVADEQGAAFMSIFTTFGSFSIAAGILLIFLIFVMLAAERRSELGIARAVGTRRGHLVQMFLYEGARLRPRGGGRRRAARRWPSRTRWCSRWPACSARSRTSTIAYSVTSRQRRHRLRDRRAADARGRRVLGLARQPDEHRHGDPQPARAAASPARGARAGCSGAVGRRRSARFWSSRASRRRTRSARLRRLARRCSASFRSPALRARPSGPSFTTAGLALVAWFVLPMSRWLLRRPQDGLLDLHPRRPR